MGLDTSMQTVIPLPTVPTVPPPSPTSPPILELIRFASSSLGVISTYSRRSFSYIIGKPFWTTLAVASRPLSYLLAPVFVFLYILLDVFILAPYVVVKAVLVNVYPIYVFLGASLLCAACIGLGARLWVQAIRYVIFGSKPATRPPAAAPRARKRVSIKDMKKEH